MIARFSAIDEKKTDKFLFASSVFKIERPMNVIPDENVSIDFTNKVGGFLGMGKTQCDAKISVNQNHFYPGSKIDVTLDVDNSKCASDIDFFQIQLIQKVAQRPNNKYNCFYRETDVCKNKVKAKMLSKQSGLRAIDLAVVDKLPITYGFSMTNLETAMKTELTPSFNGKFLVVSYVVRVMIRHSSWNSG